MQGTPVTGRLGRLLKIFLAVAIFACAVPAFASAATFNVDADDSTPDLNTAGPDCGQPSSTNRCDTLQKGIDEAEQFDGDGPGDVVRVFPGEDNNVSYNESVTISEAGLFLRGAQAGIGGTRLGAGTSPSVETESIVNPTATAGAGQDPSAGPGKNAFTVNADNVTIDGFSIMGAGGGAGASGIALNNSNANVGNNVIRENTIGVDLEGAGTGNNISNNAFYSNDAVGSASGNGIYADTPGVDSLNISGNRFEGNDNDSVTLLPGASPYNALTISGNTSANEDNGGYNINGVTNSVISGNRLTDTNCSAMFIGGADNLSISKNVIDGSGCSGIRFAGTNDSYEQNGHVTVQGNDITDNLGDLSGGAPGDDGAGIRIADESFVPDAGADELEVHANRIFGNSPAAPGNIGGGLRNEENGGDIDVDAENNWWGCNDGPAIPANDCDDAVGQPDVTPFLKFRVTANPTADTVPGGQSTITGDYLTNSAGATPAGVAGLFPSVPVEFTQTGGPGNLVVGFPSVPQDPQTASTTNGAASVRLESDDPGVADVEGTSDADQTDETQQTDSASVTFTNGPAGGGGGGGGGGNNNNNNTGGNNNANGVLGTTGTNVINGTPGNDTINGTSGDDVINCGAGDDVVNGGGGDDVINCDGGNDKVKGGSGNDRVNGQSGRDSVSGGSGKDRVTGGSGRDRVSGNSGNDRVSGNSGSDRASGGSGNDRVSGNSGNDRLSGNSGKDRLSGGSGKDRLSCGSGNDRASGGSGRDKVSGNGGKDRLSGNGGNDRLSGDTGRDRLFGGSGNDRLFGGPGLDLLNGGSGNNVLIQ